MIYVSILRAGVVRELSSATLWNEQSLFYPDADDPSFLRDGNEILHFCQQAQELYKDKKILDIGTGSGALALRFAPLCDEVYALDISEKMLEKLTVSANKAGITNIVPLLGSFESLSPLPYDFAIASMTPAISSSEMFAKMISIANGGVIVAWDNLRENSFYRTLFDYHNHVYSPTLGQFEKFILCCQSAKITIKTTTFVSTWSWEGEYDLAYERAKNILTRYGITPNSLAINAALEEFCIDKYYKDTTSARKGIILWRKP